MQAEIYRGPKTGIVVAGAVLAIALTIAILIVAGSAGDSSYSNSRSSAQSNGIVQPASVSGSDVDVPMSLERTRFLEMNVLPDAGEADTAKSIEEIRFLEMNELPESSGDFAGIVPGAEIGNLSLQQQLFPEQNLSLPGDTTADADALTYEEIKFLEENIWGS